MNRLTAIIHLERHILDQKRPHFVAESIRIETSLYAAKEKRETRCQSDALFISWKSSRIQCCSETHWKKHDRKGRKEGTDLELQPTLDVFLQRLGDGLVKIAEDLHGELRVDAFIADEIIEGIRQSEPDAMCRPRVSVFVLFWDSVSWEKRCRHTCFDGIARRRTVGRKPCF